LFLLQEKGHLARLCRAKRKDKQPRGTKSKNNLYLSTDADPEINASRYVFSTHHFANTLQFFFNLNSRNYISPMGIASLYASECHLDHDSVTKTIMKGIYY